jgi:long-subunit fatty acid transport protein
MAPSGRLTATSRPLISSRPLAPILALLSLAHRGCRRYSGLVALASLAAIPAEAQGPILGQDEIDFQSRTSVILGSGARALGMGGAFLARADDATAASWNPAGLSYLRRPELSLVGARNVFNVDVEGGDISRFRGTSPDFAALTFPLSIKSAGGAVQLSFQRVIPFDGSRQIERFSGGPSVSLTSSGGFDVVSFGTGWKLTGKLRLGVTVNRWIRGYEQDQKRSVDAGRTRQIATDWKQRGWNTNLGLIFSPVENLNLAVVGNTPFTAKVDLAKSRTDFLPNPEGVLEPVSSNAYASDAVRLAFPGAFGVGASWRAQSRLTLSADYTRTFWSRAYVYNFFTLPQSESPGLSVAVAPAPNPKDTYDKLPYPYVAETDQADSEQLRFGVEYVLIGRRLKVPVRGGYFNDRQIRRDRNGRAPRYNGFTAGTGIIVGSVLLDAAYLYEFGSFVDLSDQKNTQHTHRFLASLIYRFGGLP